MEIEENNIVPEKALTPELDADLPKKGVPRLMIEKLVLENFKSYAGVKEIGPFHKCFTAIVGPNGSGKSNVIDALLFVFGKRASKLRLKKVSELIHNSANVAPCTFARVSVHFQNIIDLDDDKYEVVPQSQLIVTRVAYQNNSSKYFINNKACSVAEVTSLLKERGVDLDNNRFLILQGEVEQISLMKPKRTSDSEEGLLEYLEDIIGTASLVPLIEKKEVEVEKLNETRGEVLNRVKIVEKEKNTLEIGKKEADLYLTKERELACEQALLYQYYIYESQMEETDLQNRFEAGNRKIVALKEELQNYVKQIKEMESNYKTVCSDYEAINKEMMKCKEEYESYDRRDVQNQENMKAIKKSIEGKKKLLEKTKKAQEDRRALKERLESSLIRMREEMESIQDKKAVVEDELSGLLTKYKEEINGLKEKKKEIESMLRPVEERYARLDGALQEKKTQFELIQNKYTKVEKEVKEMAEFVESKAKQLNDMMADMQGKKVELAHSDGDILQLKEREARCRQEVESIDKELKKKRAQLVEKRGILSENANRSTVLKVLMSATQPHGELYGVGLCGRLGDLGEIDSFYDVAVSTAASALDYIVVETTDAAQRCIQYLKDHNAGRARFMVLEEVEKNTRWRQSFSCPANAKRLFDLITVYDDKYRPAFYYALNDTLVTSTIDIATKLAYQKSGVMYRIVTYNGALIEKVGTMSGGGNRNRHGLMRLRDGQSDKRRSIGEESSESSVEELESIVSVLNKRYDASNKELREVRDEIEKKTKSIPALHLQISKLEIDVSTTQSVVEKKQGELVLLKAQLEERRGDLERCRSLQDAIGKEEAVVNGVKSEMKSYKTQAIRIDKEIELVGGESIQKKRKELKGCGDRYAALQKEINASNVQIKSCIRDGKEKSEEETRLTNEIKNGEEQKQVLKGQMELLEQEASKVLVTFKSVQEVQKVKAKEMETWSSRYEQCKAENAKKEEELASEEDGFGGIQKQMEEITKQRDIWVGKIAAIRKKTWENTRDLEEEEGRDMEEEEERDMEEEGRRIIPDVEEEKLRSLDKTRIERSIMRLEAEKDNLKKNANLSCIAEFRSKNKEYKLREKELDEITSKRDAMRKEYDDLRKNRLNLFMEGFNTITMKLKEMYQMITLGGDAELELVDSLDPFSEGIVFSVRPPKKSWKSISNLSGGEKTLSSLALVFALHHYKPTPLYVMDEIDAALDFRNVSIVGHYIKERTKNAQFVVISLRNNMFELADKLVGIYKTDNCTDSISINPADLCT